MVTIEKLNHVAQDVAGQLVQRFPGMKPEQVRYWARFVALSSNIIRETNAELITEGKELNQRGLEIVFDESFKLAE